MKFLFLLHFILALVAMNNSPAFSYTKAQNRSLNIAHRGLSSVLPQNTIQAFEAALYLGADFVELDVQLTKDKQVVVIHDPFLSELTDIHRFPEHNPIKQTRQYQEKMRTDVWVDQLNWEQVRKLKIKQKLVKGRIDSFDYHLGFSTLNQTLRKIIEFNEKHKGKRNPDGRIGGVLIEAKDSKFYRSQFNTQIGESILTVLKHLNLDSIEESQLKCPIVLQAFDFETVKYWSQKTDLPIVFLSKHKEKFEEDLEEIAKYASGVGVKESFFYDEENKRVDTRLLKKMRQLGLLVYCWTFRDDDLVFNSKDYIEMYEIAQKQLKLDGIITEFPDTFGPLSLIFRRQIQRQASTQEPIVKTNEL